MAMLLVSACGASVEPNETNDSGLTYQQQREVRVKNTFIDVDEEEAVDAKCRPRRRASSLPPMMSTLTVTEHGELHKFGEEDSPMSQAWELSTDAGSETSWDSAGDTSPAALRAGDTSPAALLFGAVPSWPALGIQPSMEKSIDAQCQQAAPSPCSSVSTPTSTQSRRWSDITEEIQLEAACSERTSLGSSLNTKARPWQPSVSSATASAVPAPPLRTPLARPALGYGTALNTGARPFQPIRTAAPEAPQSESVDSSADYMTEVSSVMASVAKAMTQGIATGILADVQIVQSRRGFSLVAVVDAEDATFQFYSKHILSRAKAELLRATQAAASVSLIGSEGLPFREKNNSIGVSLAQIQDPNQTCWDIDKTGLCKRGEACRWQHPQRVQRIYVSAHPISKFGHE